MSKAQSQWGKIPIADKGKNEYEIDLIGSSKDLFYIFEFKWSELDYTEAIKVLDHLVMKATFVQRLPANPHFGIVAKKILEKDKLRAANYLAYDLDDLSIQS